MKKKFIEMPLAGDLRWRQPHAGVRYHELRLGRSLFATLRWKKMFGSLAVAEFCKERYTFKRVGFLHPSITVRREGEDEDLAVMRFDGSFVKNAVLGLTGVLEFRTRERFAFDSLGRLKARWAFSDENGNLMVTVDRKIKGKPSGAVTVSREFIDAPHLNILVSLAWYAVIMDYEEREALIGTGLGATSDNSGV